MPGRAVADAPGTSVPHAEAAWDWWRRIGAPKYHVAPMVDQSELAFRMLCRNHGATAAYTPMLHARLFLEGAPYREEHFTTCAADRPVFAQFCANDPSVLLGAARLVQHECDAVDLNLGCPQRIAKRGRYGAFLMDDLPLVRRLVAQLAGGLDVPVTVKIRCFPGPDGIDVQRTVEYARMIEAAGAFMLAVHGRTRDQKDASNIRADWDAIRAVKAALAIPVIANGNVRHLGDAHECLAYTGADGVMSALALLKDPALFSPRRLQPGGAYRDYEAPAMMLEYLDLLEHHPTHPRMVRGHVFHMLGAWLSEHTDLRDRLNTNGAARAAPGAPRLPFEAVCREVCVELQERIAASGRDHPVPKLSERVLARMEREAAMAAAIDEQAREERWMTLLAAKRASAAGGALQAEAAACKTCS